MSGEWLSAFALADWVALAWFFACWTGYGWIVEHGPLGSMRGLLGASHHYRLEWGRQLLRREARVGDAALIGNLMQSVSFYANTTIYVIAGLLALLTNSLSKRIKTVQKKIVTETNALAGSTTESLRNIELVKSLGLTHQEIRRLNLVFSGGLDLEKRPLDQALHLVLVARRGLDRVPAVLEHRQGHGDRLSGR